MSECSRSACVALLAARLRACLPPADTELLIRRKAEHKFEAGVPPLLLICARSQVKSYAQAGNNSLDDISEKVWGC